MSLFWCQIEFKYITSKTIKCINDKQIRIDFNFYKWDHEYSDQRIKYNIISRSEWGEVLFLIRYLKNSIWDIPQQNTLKFIYFNLFVIDLFLDFYNELKFQDEFYKKYFRETFFIAVDNYFIVVLYASVEG